MKIIPDKIGRKLGEQGLLASEKAPKLLFVGGVVGMVGSTVLACRATLKLSDVLDNIENDKQARTNAKDDVDSGRAKNVTYPDDEYRHDLSVIGIRGVGKIARLYAPAVLLGGASIFALTKSHNILQDRNLALTAAYAAVDGAFNRYRERVVDRYGEEVDNELQFDYERVDEVDEDTGEIVSEERVIGAPGSSYARWYDHESSRNWDKDHDINVLVLNQVQVWANEKLRKRGHLFLNEVFSELGLDHTEAGAVVGWRYERGSGDDFIDFGVWENGTNVIKRERLGGNGREGAVLLDFNVDGVIHNQIEGDQLDRRN